VSDVNIYHNFVVSFVIRHGIFSIISGTENDPLSDIKEELKHVIFDCDISECEGVLSIGVWVMATTATISFLHSIRVYHSECH
jgi:hypothetical protein